METETETATARYVLTKEGMKWSMCTGDARSFVYSIFKSSEVTTRKAFSSEERQIFSSAKRSARAMRCACFSNKPPRVRLRDPAPRRRRGWFGKTARRVVHAHTLLELGYEQILNNTSTQRARVGVAHRIESPYAHLVPVPSLSATQRYRGAVNARTCTGTISSNTWSTPS